MGSHSSICAGCQNRLWTNPVDETSIDSLGLIDLVQIGWFSVCDSLGNCFWRRDNVRTLSNIIERRSILRTSVVTGVPPRKPLLKSLPKPGAWFAWLNDAIVVHSPHNALSYPGWLTSVQFVAPFTPADSFSVGVTSFALTLLVCIKGRSV